MMFVIRFFRQAKPEIHSAARTFSRFPYRQAASKPLEQCGQHTSFARSQTWVRPGAAWRRIDQSFGRRHYQRQAYSYQRFQSRRSIFHAWAARPTFYYEVGGLAALCGGFYVYNLEPVPVSGRNRFNVISEETEIRMSKQMYDETMQQYRNQILPHYSKEHRLVQRVLDRLVPHSGLEDAEWEIHVINDDQRNAFVIPGGKVFVFRGILDVCEGEDGLAAVLGHEIAHNVARHAAERMSQAFVLLPVALIGSFLVGIDVGISRLLVNLAFTLPGSRAQEQEADYIGLLMMAESCYNPAAAIGLWSRMEKLERGAPPQFLSTHPSSHNRLEKIRDWLPEAEAKRNDSDCSTIGPYVNDFKGIAQFTRW